MTRHQMENKLIEWNPNWNKETIENWSDIQLKQIYKKEVNKTVEFIRKSLGLVN